MSFLECRTLVLLLVVALPVVAGGAEREREPLLSRLDLGKSDGPVEVTAERLDFAYEARLLTYEGSVVVKQGEITLRSDRLVVSLDGDGELGLRSIVAEGNVALKLGNRRATGRRAVFDQRAQTVVLSGDALLQEGANQVSGDRIVIDLARETSVVHGGEGRVRAVLYPPTREPTENAAGDD